MKDTETLWISILTALQEMGSESVKAGKPYGLRGYPDFHRELYPGSFRKYAWEEPLIAGIASRLRNKGLHVQTESLYPTAKEKCDLIVTLTEGARLWLECKTAFKESLGEPSPGYGYGYDYEGTKPYSPRGKGCWTAGVADIGAQDLLKLKSLRRQDAEFIGILLLGFDRSTVPLGHDELYDLLPRDLASWTALHKDEDGVMWPDPYPPRAARGFRDRVWLWITAVT
jgi:hypothetical protein